MAYQNMDDDEVVYDMDVQPQPAMAPAAAPPMTYGQQTSQAINSGVSFLETMWNRYATMIVLILLLVIVFVMYRKEIMDSVASVAGIGSSAVSSTYGAATGAVEATYGAAKSAVGAVGTAISDTSSDIYKKLAPGTAPAASAAAVPVLKAGDLAGLNAPLPTGSEIQALFNF